MARFVLIPSREINRSQHNAVAEKHTFGIYATSWYLDAVTDNWGIYADTQSDGFIPVGFKKRPGYKNIYQPFFCMFTLPFGLDQASFDAALQQLHEEYQYIQIHLPNSLENSCPNFKKTDRIRQEIRVKNYADLAKCYAENATRILKKAEKNNFILDLTITPHWVTHDFIRSAAKKIPEITPASSRALERLMEAAIQQHQGFAAGVLQDSKRIASAFFLKHHDRLIYLKGSVTDTGKKAGAMYWLFDQIFRKEIRQETIIDFGGSNQKAVAEFYHKLGGVDVSYSELETRPRGVARLVKELKPKLIKARKFLGK